MTETPEYGPDDQALQAGSLTVEEESELIQDTSADNGESDFPDPPQDNDEFDAEVGGIEEWVDLDEADDDLDLDDDYVAETANGEV